MVAAPSRTWRYHPGPSRERVDEQRGVSMMTTARRRRSALVLPVLAVGALALAGCSGGEGGDGGAVTYWSQWEQGEPQAEILQEAIDDFTAETGTEVEVEWQGRQTMQEVQPLLRSGDVPDVVDASSNDIRATLVRAEQARDLSDLFGAQVPGEDATVEDALGDYDELITDEAMDGPFMLPTILMAQRDRKSTRLNSSHVAISYAVFCL